MNWNEQDHPRDDDGRFTDKDGAVGTLDPRKIEYRQNTPYWKILEDDRKREEEAERRKSAARIPLDFFSKENRKKLTREDIPSEVYGFANDKLMTANHQKHAREMGYKDQKQYEKGAIEFWKHGEGTIYACDVTQCFYKYNRRTREFVSVNPAGEIKTFYVSDKKAFDRKIIQYHLREISK